MGERLSGTTLAATNDLSAGSVCKRRDAVTLGRKKGLQPRANEPPADSFSFKLGRAAKRRPLSSGHALSAHKKVAQTERRAETVNERN